MRMPSHLAGSLFALAVCVAGANAQPISYLVQGTFDDTGTFAGMFTYDDTTNIYSGINVVSTPGTARTGNSYFFVCGLPDIPACGDGFSPFPTSVAFQTTNAADQTGLPTLFMGFNPPLNQILWAETAALHVGGFSGDEGTCQNAECTVGSAADTRFITGGSAATESIPLFEFLYWQ